MEMLLKVDVPHFQHKPQSSKETSKIQLSSVAWVIQRLCFYCELESDLGRDLLHQVELGRVLNWGFGSRLDGLVQWLVPIARHHQSSEHGPLQRKSLVNISMNVVMAFNAYELERSRHTMERVPYEKLWNIIACFWSQVLFFCHISGWFGNFRIFLTTVHKMSRYRNYLHNHSEIPKLSSLI